MMLREAVGVAVLGGRYVGVRVADDVTASENENVKVGVGVGGGVIVGVTVAVKSGDAVSSDIDADREADSLLDTRFVGDGVGGRVTVAVGRDNDSVGVDDG